MVKLAVTIIVFWAGLACGQVVPGQVLRHGEPAPADGAFFTRESAVALVGALRERTFLAEQVKLLQGEIDAKTEQITAQEAAIQELKTAQVETGVALVKAEVIIQNWGRIEESMKTVSAEYRAMAGELRAANEQLRKDLHDARVENRWTKILSLIPIIGIVALAF